MIEIRTLDNGIKLVLEEMQQFNSVSCGIWVKTGAMDEDEEYGGISHFVEHMMFKGTEKRDAYQISYDLDKIGAVNNAFTGKEATCYFAKATSEHMFDVFDILTDMLENSVFPAKEMSRERHVIQEEIKMNRDDAEDYAHELLAEGILKGTSQGNSIAGTGTSIGRVSRNVMKDYVRDQYVRDAIVVSVAGKFDADEVAKYFGEKFSGMKKSKPQRKWVKAKKIPVYKSSVRDINQAHIYLGTGSIDMKDDRNFALMILNNIMGGSMSSRLFQNIREKRGLAYTVYSAQETFERDGLFEIYAGVAMDNVRKAVIGIADELKKLSDSSVTPEELDSSREQMKASYTFSKESSSARMLINGKNALLIDHTYTTEEVMEGFNKVTTKDIDELIAMIADMRKYSISVVSGKKTNPRKVMEGLK